MLLDSRVIFECNTTKGGGMTSLSTFLLHSALDVVVRSIRALTRCSDLKLAYSRLNPLLHNEDTIAAVSHLAVYSLLFSAASPLPATTATATTATATIATATTVGGAQVEDSGHDFTVDRSLQR